MLKENLQSILNATRTPSPVYSILLYDVPSHLSLVFKRGLYGALIFKLQASNAIFYYAQNGDDNFLFYGFQAHELWVFSCNSRERPHPNFKKNVNL